MLPYVTSLKIDQAAAQTPLSIPFHHSGENTLDKPVLLTVGCFCLGVLV